MRMFDSVIVKCPTCGKPTEFQSKGGECLLNFYSLENCPTDVLEDVNRHSPYDCECDALFQVNTKNRTAELVGTIKCKNCNDTGKIKYKDIEQSMYSWQPWKERPCVCVENKL